MTWIVGIAPPFGHSILVSDIRVTFTDPSGREYFADCLQKIYPLGRFVIGGFAGSVRLGFRLLEVLRSTFSSIPPDNAWNIQVISHSRNWLPRLMRRVFRAAPMSQRELGLSVVLASAHPTRNRGDATWPWTDIHVFSCPEFAARKAGISEVLAIGSGASMRTHMDALRKRCSDYEFWKSAVLGDEIHATQIAHEVRRMVAENSVRSVSPLFQIGLVTRGRCVVTNHEYVTYEQGGECTDHTLPPLACGWEEFEKRCEGLSRHAIEAVC